MSKKRIVLGTFQHRFYTMMLWHTICSCLQRNHTIFHDSRPLNASDRLASLPEASRNSLSLNCNYQSHFGLSMRNWSNVKFFFFSNYFTDRARIEATLIHMFEKALWAHRVSWPLGLEIRVFVYNFTVILSLSIGFTIDTIHPISCRLTDKRIDRHGLFVTLLFEIWLWLRFNRCAYCLCPR